MSPGNSFLIAISCLHLAGGINVNSFRTESSQAFWVDSALTSGSPSPTNETLITPDPDQLSSCPRPLHHFNPLSPITLDALSVSPFNASTIS